MMSPEIEPMVEKMEISKNLLVFFRYKTFNIYGICLKRAVNAFFCKLIFEHIFLNHMITLYENQIC